jgi:hypothetical protein
MPPKKDKSAPNTSIPLGSSTSPLSQGATQPASSTRQFTLEDAADLILKINTALSSTVTSCLDRIVDSIDRKLSNRLDTQETTHFDMNKRFDKLEKMYSDLKLENDHLHTQIQSLQTKLNSVTQAVDDQDQYSRGTNLLIHGLEPILSPDGSESSLESSTIQSINSFLGLSLTTQDISAIHRTSKPRSHTVPRSNPSAPSSNRPSPVIIQFVNKKVRNDVLSKRKLLKGKPLVITEQLTKSRADLLKKATDLVHSNNLNSAWSQNGTVLVKSLSNHVVQINNMSDLSRFN